MKYISNEIPMLMIYELNNSGFYHTSVVTGVDPCNQSYILNDPDPKKGINYNFKPTFDTNWIMFPILTLTHLK